jgi:nicotinate-nucleotide pyrophosphorylase (carboxylating)
LTDPPGRDEVRRALAEDRADDDVTTRLLGARGECAALGRFIAEDRFVVAGWPVVAYAFQELDAAVRLDALIPEGAWTTPGATIGTVRARARTHLAGERVALNFLQRLSGVATLTRQAVDAVAGTGATITHTRKTTPGLRALEQYAVTVGGGVANRSSLADVILWKDNHWALLDAAEAGLAGALGNAPPRIATMVEVETDEQFEQALAAGVRHILADNQSPARIAAWVRRAGPAVTIEASGGITAGTARAYGEAGATRISIGALTHSVPAAPIRYEVSLS